MTCVDVHLLVQSDTLAMLNPSLRVQGGRVCCRMVVLLKIQGVVSPMVV